MVRHPGKLGESPNHHRTSAVFEDTDGQGLSEVLVACCQKDVDDPVIRICIDPHPARATHTRHIDMYDAIFCGRGIPFEKLGGLVRVQSGIRKLGHHSGKGCVDIDGQGACGLISGLQYVSTRLTLGQLAPQRQHDRHFICKQLQCPDFCSLPFAGSMRP